MLSYLHSYFTTINHEHTKKNQSKYIYQDELEKSSTTSTKLIRRKAHHKSTEAKSSLLQGKNDQSKGKTRETKVVIEEKKEIRVKVRMTKEEAKRLLSKSKKGGLLEFGDVAHELSKIPANRIRLVDSSTIVVGGQVLQSIVEED